MRRKSSNNNGGGYNNQQRKPRFQQGGGGHGHGHQHGGHNRPRKNYAASREKYLAQARDALAAGDRVLAENWYQHAEHCYRMMVEEGYQVRNTVTSAQDQLDEQPGNADGHDGASAAAAEGGAETGGQLPAFLTNQYEPKPVDPSTIQNWEERDA